MDSCEEDSMLEYQMNYEFIIFVNVDFILWPGE
jgi:hypothetical protein